jgi:hypothetical protein
MKIGIDVGGTNTESPEPRQTRLAQGREQAGGQFRRAASLARLKR